ncbi:PREDICTED: protein NRT1/ PTR FAMILY 8.4 isoform X2 [Camelina sativa]|uniref:Protein NRT1/ PTR FAMILY 8.4 isoform X2 n=1 Tax=Camelina sativa TaxID=90675 RepID=A0ABM1RLU9_CAMSA|nr:PREDICTED: protein NRT1/ PTR FAMILY 8.4 isoform X2 [Camelina sativa]
MGSIDEEVSLLEAEESLIQEELKLYAEDGSIDIYGNPPLKQKTGNWKACPFIFANECCERLAYYGIAKNLITYFTNELHETNVAAARHVMTWQGTCYITPLIGALIADAYWGRYWTIACFSAIYFTGMVALTLSASVPGLKPAECIGSLCPPATTVQSTVLFSGLYLIALGTGGIKPCVSSFGADQFDKTDPSERVRKASFFNWFYFTINVGAFVSSTVLVWVQENCGWELGFLIPTVFMGLATISFFFGTPLYRFQKPKGSPITRVCQVLVAAYRNFNLKFSEDQCAGFLTKPQLYPKEKPNLIHGSSIYTLFVQQGRSMKRTIGSFEIPPATLGMFDTASVLISVPIYDRLIVPFVRRFTGLAKGFTELQRMGIGLFVSVLSLTFAAIVETVRLQLARDLDLVESGDTVPLTIFWQIPQYFLMGTAGVFFFVGRIEFFYEQSPDSMRSLCSAWALLTTTLGNYLSSMIITVVAYLSGKDCWIPSDNINNGHLDYFFWLLVCLGFVNIPVFVFFSVKYPHKKV